MCFSNLLSFADGIYNIGCVIISTRTTHRHPSICREIPLIMSYLSLVLGGNGVLDDLAFKNVHL